MKRIIRAIAYALGYEIARRRLAPDDLDAFEQQRRLLSNIACPVILDVGAHKGETSRAYAELFPTAKIHAFEPFPESFGELVRSTAEFPQITPHPFGLAEISQELGFYVNAFSPTNSLLETHQCAAEAWGEGLLDTRENIVCRFSTLDTFLAEMDIRRIDLLKLDVQGAEYRVLEGGANALVAGLIDVIYMELILMPTYKEQRSLAYYLQFLERNGMKLFGLYNLSHIRGRIRQLDAIFVTERF